MVTERRRVDIKVPVLARVEGEGAMEMSIRDGRIQDLKLRIYEPPRFFEKFVEGHPYHHLPELVARICGICPVAYQMSAVQAAEQAFGFSPNPWVQAMRRLFYCGEWIQSHALHIHLLAAPDFLGFDSVIAMADRYPDEVRRGLRLQELGNRIIRLFGGRSVHPVGACVGGFHHAPAEPEVRELAEDVRQALPDAEALVAWVASMNLPAHSQQFVNVALRHPADYAMYEGRLFSNHGLDIRVDEFQDHFHEQHVPHSTALHASLNGKPYLVGPLARMNLNGDRLHEAVHDAMQGAGIGFPTDNMFHSIVARAAEIYQALLEALRLMESYRPPGGRPWDAVQPVAGVGIGCTEAPRGILWHRYEFDEQGEIRSATIVPPTSQNQARIEQDLRQSLEAFGLERDDDALRLHGEMVIRNYDPCISCATHFLKLTVKR
jgi:sulfhydrogenase subunit alpha